ncbi:MAG: hypothetical protein COS84_10260 [Armatimonadetes bacterium CG07_land_8_20_14_0_80_40_9]|nr:MAG: hypothetical protein COS84_10260 [Armatimonadetes bacterium CG07_land_8_20_14_0_80_40_9]
MALDKVVVKRWVINHQHDVLIERYQNIKNGDEVRAFFGKYMYPPFEERREYEERNEFFRKLAAAYNQGRLRRIFGAATALFAPLISMSEKMKELPKYLKIVVELYDLTNELDERLISALSKIAKDEKDLTPENYRTALKKTSTYEERAEQIDSMINLGGYATEIVRKGRLLNFLVESCPRLPLFAENKYVRSINETITMIKTAYRAFKHSREDLGYFQRFCEEREYEYLDYLMGN